MLPLLFSVFLISPNFDVKMIILPNFGQGPLPKMAGKSPGFVHLKVHFLHENDMNFHVFQEEFLLTGPSALGMFVTSEGISQRPPLQWSENLISVGYVHPYIIAMNDEFITVHRYENDSQLSYNCELMIC